MKRTRHTAEQIIRKLKTAEQLIAQGKTVADVCRVIEVTQPTYRFWNHEERFSAKHWNSTVMMHEKLQDQGPRS